MPHHHTVAPGECFLTLAELYGFVDYRALYDHPVTPRSRGAVPIRTFSIPEMWSSSRTYGLREESVPVDRRHSFCLKRPTRLLKLIVEDVDGTPGGALLPAHCGRPGLYRYPPMLMAGFRAADIRGRANRAFADRTPGLAVCYGSPEPARERGDPATNRLIVEALPWWSRTAACVFRSCRGEPLRQFIVQTGGQAKLLFGLAQRQQKSRPRPFAHTSYLHRLVRCVIFILRCPPQTGGELLCYDMSSFYLDFTLRPK